MRKARSICLVVALVLSCMTRAVGQEEEPAGLVGSPGMVPALRALLAVVDDFPEVEPYIVPTVNWLYNAEIAATDANERPSKRSSLLKVGRSTLPILQANQRAPNKRFEEVANHLLEAHYRAFESQYTKTKSGEGLVFGRRFGVIAGNSQNGPLQRWSGIYEMTGDPRALRALKALANQVKESAVEAENERGETETFWWWWNWGAKDGESNRIWHTGHCHGVAGTVIGLLRAHEVIPDHRYHDGTSLRDLANGGLEWLAGKAIKREGGNGLDWPQVRGSTRTDNTGYGAGRAGIGDAFLRGYRANLKTDPERANRYLDVAKLTAVDILEQLETGWDYFGGTYTNQYETQNAMNIGWCNGVGGTPRFLFPMAEAVKEIDPAFADRCINGCRLVGKWFSKRAIPWGDGGLLWTRPAAEGRPMQIPLGEDVGLCGWVMCTHLLATELDEPEYWKLARGSTKALLSLAEKEGDGIKWPHRKTVAAEKSAAEREDSTSDVQETEPDD